MEDKRLLWKKLSESTVLHTPIFDVERMRERSETGIEGDYLAIHAPNWIVTIPVLENDFILVRQWRFGQQQLTTEFPGGLADEGEDPAAAAARELEEETGFRAGKITVLGQCSPNPALFSNTLTICLAEDLVQTHHQHLDRDEVLDYLQRPIEEVIDDFGNSEYTAAYMGTAIGFYLRETLKRSR